MPTEETQKGEIYFKTEDDKEYKKLGRCTKKYSRILF